MLKKLMALATTATMLGANAAAYAIGIAKTVVRDLAGASTADKFPPGDGRNIQPSIPPMPPEEKAAPAPRQAEPKKARTVKAARQHTVAKPRAKAAKAAKAGKHPKHAAK